MDSSGVSVGDIIRVSRAEAPEPVPFGTVTVVRDRARCSVVLTADDGEGYMAEVLQVVPCE